MFIPNSTQQGELVAEAVSALTCAFASHTLDEVGGLALMDRLDTKFLLPLEHLPDLLMAMQEDYSLLMIAGRRALRYETIYLDTQDFGFYHQHLTGRTRRMKVRLRTYVDTASRFVEVKRKNARGLTEKTRMALSVGAAAELDVAALLRELEVAEAQQLRQQLRIDYWRLSLQSATYAERMSIDIGLQAERLDDGRMVALRDLAIVELKQSRLNRASPVAAAMRRLGARPLSLSKYCLSAALLFPERVRHNSFKPLLARLQPYSRLVPGVMSHVHA